MKVQIYAIGKDLKLVHAGVHEVERINITTIRKLETDWRKWRTEYLNTHPGDYPLRNDNRRVATIHVYPIDNPSGIRIFNLV